LETLGKSLMKRRNSKGPSNDPWGTPQVFFSRLELFPLIEAY